MLQDKKKEPRKEPQTFHPDERTHKPRQTSEEQKMSSYTFTVVSQKDNPVYEAEFPPGRNVKASVDLLERCTSL